MTLADLSRADRILILLGEAGWAGMGRPGPGPPHSALKNEILIQNKGKPSA